MRYVVLGMLLQLLAVPACSSTSGGAEPSGQSDSRPFNDAGGTAGAAGASAGSAGSAGMDAGCEDCEDAGAEAAGGSGGGTGGSSAGDVEIYGVCNAASECVAGLTCTTVVQLPAHGQCTHGCTTDAECEASPSGNQVGCHPEAKICFSLCGIYGGECPDGLVCTANEVCLEPSNVEATKGPGEHCTGAAECLGDAECVEGENTSAYCAPKCNTNEDCNTAAPGYVGQCIDASGLFKFCMYFCGMMAGGASCPGDLVCEANTICR